MSDRKPEVAVFDKSRVLIDIKEVDPADHVTDPKRRQMKLSLYNDVRATGMIGKYRASPHYKVLEQILSNFFETIGITISRWQGIENMLLALFTKLIAHRNVYGLSEAFLSIVSLRTRLEMVNAVAVSVVTEELLTEWKSLYRRIDKCSRKRNTIAHGNSRYITGNSTANDFILETKADTAGLSKEQIAELGALFGELGVDLDAFINKL